MVRLALMGSAPTDRRGSRGALRQMRRAALTKPDPKSAERRFGASPALVDAAVAVGRVLMAAIFIIEGYGKIVGYADVAAYMRSFGVPPVLLPLVIVTELGGGLLILTGLLTRAAAIALAGFALLTALIFHTGAADPGAAVQFQKNLAIAGGFLVLAAYGPGAWSLDAWLVRRAGSAATK
jgi:putative oxidoreductase